MKKLLCYIQSELPFVKKCLKEGEVEFMVLPDPGDSMPDQLVLHEVWIEESHEQKAKEILGKKGIFIWYRKQ